MRRRKFLRGLMAVVFWLAVWQFAAWRLSLSVQWSELLLPYPTSVARRLVELMTGGEFWLTALASLGRILAAFLAGAAAGALFAALCSVSGVCSALISPLMLAVRATPVASFIILLLLWLPGPGWVSFTSAALMTAPVFWSNLSRAVEGVDGQLLEMARAYRLGRAKTFRHIYVPALHAALISACESGVGLAWKSGVAAEVLTRPAYAIGRMVYESRLYLETVDLFAWTAAVVLLSLAVEKCVRALVKRGERNA